MNSDPYFSSLQGGDYHVFPDGRVLMTGAHTLNDPVRGFVGLYNLIWFTNTGYLDTTRVHRRSNGVMYAFEEQPDGKFLCTGLGNSYDDQPVAPIFRIHPDASLDTGFQTDITWGEATEFRTLSDGRVLVGGPLKREGSTDTLNLVRLLPDGMVDLTFTLHHFTSEVYGLYLVSGILPLADGRIVITGGFDHIDGVPRGGIALLGADGELLDDAFTGAGCGGFVNTMGGTTQSIRNIVAAPDGTYYIHGGYHGYDDGSTNDAQQRMVSRLHGLDVGVREVAAIPLGVFPNPTHGDLIVQFSAAPEGTTLLMTDVCGKVVLQRPVPPNAARAVLDVELPAGIYMLRLAGRAGTALVVVE
ncbi:MAG: T9SS type A sorting domain-containing protein [Flavobacteriales bacterium]